MEEVCALTKNGKTSIVNRADNNDRLYLHDEVILEEVLYKTDRHFQKLIKQIESNKQTQKSKGNL